MAARYRVGAGGVWSDTAHWSAASGGASGASAPSSVDDAYFDSGASGTVTCDVPPDCASLDFTGGAGSPGNFAGTFNFGAVVTVRGSLVLSPTMTITGANALTLAGAGVHVIKCNGKQLPMSITINGTGSYTLQDAFVIPAAKTLTLTAGSLDENGKTLSCGSFSTNNSNTRALTVSGSLTVSAASGTVFALSTTTGMTLSFTGTLNVTDAGGSSKTLSTGSGMVYAALVIAAGGAGAVIISSTSTFTTMTVTGPKTVQASTSFTVGTLTLTGSSGNTVTLASSTPGTLRTLTVKTSAVAHWAVFQDISANPAASIDARDNCTDGGNNHNVLFVSPKRTVRQLLAGVA